MPRILANHLMAVVLLVAVLPVLTLACGDDDTADPTVAPSATAEPPASAPAPTATEPPPAYPVTFTDHSGTEVTIESKPEKVAALLNSVTNMVVDLGHADVVVATDEFTLAEHAAVFAGAANVGGSFFQFDLEALVALEPDLVILGDLGQHDLPGQLRTLGINVLIIGFPADIDEMLEQMITIGTVFGDAAGAEEIVADLRGRLDVVISGVPSGDAPRVYMEMDQSDPTAPYAAGPGGLHHAALLLAGGENVFGDADSSFPQVNQETILDRDPAVVILFDSVEFGDENSWTPISVEDAKARVGWEAMTAVQNDNVYPFDPGLLTTGVRLVEGIERLAEILAEARDKTTYHPGFAAIAA